ncbi:MAG TPA: P-II family nitrogen regulator [Candidatus Binatia bacterium]|jgi:nitrogen regulatory protein PII
MKKIEAIISPSRLHDVKDELAMIGVTGATVAEVHGVVRPGHVQLYRGAEYAIDTVPQVELEIVVPDELVSSVVATIRGIASADRNGDGRIFITPLEDVIRIRTGEHGLHAL